MIIKGVNPETNEEFQEEKNTVDREFVDWASVFEMTDEKIKKMIDNLDISADSKSLIYSFSKATIVAGEFVIKIGRKIVDFICRLFIDFPNVSFGMIFGAIAGFLVGAIPVLGVVLGPLLAPILVGFGLVLGLNEDIKDKALSRKIAEINGQFTSLHA